MIAKSGIYQITNVKTGDYYIGSSVNMSVRWCHHKKNAVNGSKKSPHLYSAMRKYGTEKFECKPLIICESSDLHQYEQRLLDVHYGKSTCYNCSPSADAPWRGRKMSESMKLKLSKSMKGRTAWNKGISRTSEEKQRIGIATKIAMSKLDNSCSDETKRKLSRILTGRTFSDETKKKMSLAKKGLPTWNKGKAHPTCAKLTTNQVQKIRSKYIFGIYGIQKLAKEYNMNNSTIAAIIKKRTWKHI